MPSPSEQVPTRRSVASSPALEAAIAAISGGADAPPGACLAVSVRGEIACAAHGVAQAFDERGRVAEPAPMTIDTRTDVGSVTKVLATTTSLMALVRSEPGLLEQSVAELVPWMARSPAAAATIEQLLEHRGGLWEWWPVYLSASGRQAALRAVAELPLRYPIGEARHYSDLGFQLLGAVVAAVAGCDLDAAVNELVIEPLGLSATSFATPRAGAAVAASSLGDRIERRMVETGTPYPVTADARGFAWREHVLVGEVNDCNCFHAYGSVAGHAGLFSTARDLLRFGDALLGRVGGPFEDAVVERFLRAGRDPIQGLGFRRWDTGSGAVWGHGGFPGVVAAVIPEFEASVALVTNRLHVTGEPRPTEELWGLALEAARTHCAPASDQDRRRED